MRICDQVSGENVGSKDGKRSKHDEAGSSKNVIDKCDDSKGDNKDDANPTKDYIHVRARRGQATDSHSLAERVLNTLHLFSSFFVCRCFSSNLTMLMFDYYQARREKISERMTMLQDLVPGCNRITGKAVMLDEIINYVQSLQRQVQVGGSNHLCQCFLRVRVFLLIKRIYINLENQEFRSGYKHTLNKIPKVKLLQN